MQEHNWMNVTLIILFLSVQRSLPVIYVLVAARRKALIWNIYVKEPFLPRLYPVWQLSASLFKAMLYSSVSADIYNNFI